MSDTSSRQREREIFLEAVKREDSAERIAYLDRACGTDTGLRRRVDGLVRNVPENSFLELPAAEHVETLIDPQLGGETIGATIGRYKIQEKVGEGGCGVVYVAEQSEPVHRRVALKVIKLGMDTKQVVARFEAERQALAMMDHPNIAKVLDAGTTEQGRPFFVMELVRGIKITDYCDQEKLSTRDRLNLFIKVCHAIQHAHQKGIIHRDIKPSNIMVTLHDGVPVPKVIDFGIAKATEGRLTDATVYTQLHHFIGTPAYMSPEQVEMSGLDIDTRSDIYALGVLLYELLTGRTPFDGKELVSMGLDAMRLTIREKEPARPSTKLATLGGDDLTSTAKRRSVETSKLLHLLAGDMDWIVMKCLEKDRQRRYDTANGLAADLGRHLANEPVLARPPSTIYRLQKAWCRNKVMYSAAALVIVALALGLSLATIGLKRAVAAQESEAKQRQLADEKANEADIQRQLAVDNAGRSDKNLYFSLVAQAYREVEANRPAHALALLKACPESLREWEWNHVRNRCYSISQTSHSLLERVEAMTISPTGLDIAVKVDGLMKIQALSTVGSDRIKSVPLTIPSVYTRRYSMAFSPNGTQLAAVMADDTVTLWDVAGANELLTFREHTDAVFAVAFDPDGREVASAGQGSLIRIWDAASGSEKRVFKLVREEPRVEGLAYSPDGQWLAVILWGNVVRILDSKTGMVQSETFRHSTPITAVAFSPDSQVLASTDNANIRLWDIPSGVPRGILQGHKSWITAVAFSNNGARLASCGFDREVKIWDWGGQREALSLVGHSDGVSSVAFLPDDRLLSGGFDGTVKSWQAAAIRDTSRGEIATLTGHTNRIWSLSFAPDGRLLSCAEDLKGIIWDLPSGQPAKRFDNIFDVSVSANGRQIISVPGSEDANEINRVQLLNSYSLEPEYTVSQNEVLFCAALSPNGNHLVAGGWVRDENGGRAVLCWDLRQDLPPQKIVGTHESGILDLVFTKDGRYLASVSEDSMVQIWDGTRLGERQTGRVLWPATSMRELPRIAFSPDGSQLVTGDGFNDVVVVDVATGDLALPRMRGHGGIVTCVAYSPDGKRLASAGADDTVRLWDARTGVHVRTYLGHDGKINALAFSPDSRVLASGGRDDIKLWRVESD